MSETLALHQYIGNLRVVLKILTLRQYESVPLNVFERLRNLEMTSDFDGIAPAAVGLSDRHELALLSLTLMVGDHCRSQAFDAVHAVEEVQLTVPLPCFMKVNLRGLRWLSDAKKQGPARGAVR